MEEFKVTIEIGEYHARPDLGKPIIMISRYYDKDYKRGDKIKIGQEEIPIPEDPYSFHKSIDYLLSDIKKAILKSSVHDLYKLKNGLS